MSDGTNNFDSPRNSDWKPRGNIPHGLKEAPRIEPKSLVTSTSVSEAYIYKDWKFRSAQFAAILSGLTIAEGLYHDSPNKIVLGAVAAGFSMAAGVISQMRQE